MLPAPCPELPCPPAGVGTLVVGRFADTYFERRFKRLLLLIFGLSLILFALYTVSLPIGPHPPLLPSTGCGPR